VNESGNIRNQMGVQNRSEMVAVHGTPCAILTRKSNINFIVTNAATCIDYSTAVVSTVINNWIL
jgi:hypothetical protein